MQVKILLSRSFIDKNYFRPVRNVIVPLSVSPISPVLWISLKKMVLSVGQMKEIVRYILALSHSYALPMMLNNNEDLDIDEAVNEIVECLSLP